MPAAAQNLVLAAKRLILTKGMSAVTLNAVAREAGESKGTTAYYFGNKSGLISAVMDSVIHDEYLASMSLLENVPPDELPAAIIEEMRRLDAFKDEWVVSYELFPYALRHAALRERLQELYRWYYEVKLGWLASRSESANPDTIQGLTELLAAVVDGLAIQDALGREGFDIARPYRVFQSMLESSLPDFLSGTSTGRHV